MDGTEFVKWSSSIIIGIFISMSDEYLLLIFLVSCAVVMDIVTGMIKGKINRKIESNSGYAGIWNKIALFAGLAFGMFLDAVVQYAGAAFSGDDWDLSFFQTIHFGHIIGIYIILNESISIMENLYECGIKLPKFIVNALRMSKRKIDKDNDNTK